MSTIKRPNSSISEETKLKHNPFNLKVGDLVMLDQDFECLKITRMSPGSLWSTVCDLHDNSNYRTLLTKRLSPVPKT